MTTTQDKETEIATVWRMLETAPDVKKLHSLVYQRRAGTYLYLIETPFETYPKFVIGTTDAAGVEVHAWQKFGALWSARDAWLNLTGLNIETGAVNA